jgi:hypothetical protein
MAEPASLRSQRIQVQEDDPIELLFTRGVTDGLPVVPPTEERVTRMLAAVDRDPQEVLGTVGPNYGRATVEKVAINAVMAGCHPSYFPVVVAGVEALCEESFNVHALNVTTFSATPMAIINGPIRQEIGVNCGHNALGHGFRANATIGRALRLVIRNIGGAKPQEITKATLGHPAQFTFCVGENEEESPWEPLHVEKGFRPDQSTITLFGGHSPFQINDHASRTAEQLALSIGWTMASVWNHKNFPLFSDTVLVICPEHAQTFAQDGWSKDDLRQFLFEHIRRPLRELRPGVNGGEGAGVSMIPLHREQVEPPTDETLYPKFPVPESILIIVAGGTAGRFSAAVPGLARGDFGSRITTKEIRR